MHVAIECLFASITILLRMKFDV